MFKTNKVKLRVIVIALCIAMSFGMMFLFTKTDNFFVGAELTNTTVMPEEAGAYRLTKNINLTESFEPKGETVIDLNGHTISFESATSAIITVSEGESLTIQDSVGGGMIVNTAGDVFNIDGGVLNIEGGLFSASYNPLSQGHCVYVKEGASDITVKINGGEFNSPFGLFVNVIDAQDKSYNLSIEGGTFNGVTPITCENNKKIISGGKFTTNVSAFLKDGACIKFENSYYNVNASHDFQNPIQYDEEQHILTCTVCGEKKYENHNFDVETPISCSSLETTRTCNDCNFSVTVLGPHGTITHHTAKYPTSSEDGNIDYYQCEDCNRMYSEEQCINQITNVVLPKSATPVASAGETDYYSLQEAMDKVVENGTVKLLKEIEQTISLTVNNSFTLDLNSHTITNGFNAPLFVFNSTKTGEIKFVIDDLSDNKTGKILGYGYDGNIKDDNTVLYNSVIYDNNSSANGHSITIKNGVLEAYGYVIEVNRTTPVTVEIEGGTLQNNVPFNSEELCGVIKNFGDIKFKGGSIITSTAFPISTNNDLSYKNPNGIYGVLLQNIRSGAGIRFDYYCYDALNDVMNSTNLKLSSNIQIYSTSVKENTDVVINDNYNFEFKENRDSNKAYIGYINVPEGSTLTIINGTFAYKDSNNASSFLLNICQGAICSIESGLLTDAGGVVIKNSGTLTINGPAGKGKGANIISTTNAAIQNNGTLTISGEVYVSGYNAINNSKYLKDDGKTYEDETGVVTINNGEFLSTSTTIINSGTSLTINGGVFQCTDTQKENPCAVISSSTYFEANGGYVENAFLPIKSSGTTILKGGIFTTDYSNRGYIKSTQNFDDVSDSTLKSRNTYALEQSGGTCYVYEDVKLGVVKNGNIVGNLVYGNDATINLYNNTLVNFELNLVFSANSKLNVYGGKITDSQPINIDNGGYFTHKQFVSSISYYSSYSYYDTYAFISCSSKTKTEVIFNTKYTDEFSKEVVDLGDNCEFKLAYHGLLYLYNSKATLGGHTAIDYTAEQFAPTAEFKDKSNATVFNGKNYGQEEIGIVALYNKSDLIIEENLYINGHREKGTVGKVFTISDGATVKSSNDKPNNVYIISDNVVFEVNNYSSVLLYGGEFISRKNKVLTTPNGLDVYAESGNHYGTVHIENTIFESQNQPVTIYMNGGTVDIINSVIKNTYSVKDSTNEKCSNSTIYMNFSEYGYSYSGSTYYYYPSITLNIKNSTVSSDSCCGIGSNGVCAVNLDGATIDTFLTAIYMDHENKTLNRYSYSGDKVYMASSFNIKDTENGTKINSKSSKGAYLNNCHFVFETSKGGSITSLGDAIYLKCFDPVAKFYGYYDSYTYYEKSHDFSEFANAQEIKKASVEIKGANISSNAGYGVNIQSGHTKLVSGKITSLKSAVYMPTNYGFFDMQGGRIESLSSNAIYIKLASQKAINFSEGVYSLHSQNQYSGAQFEALYASCFAQDRIIVNGESYVIGASQDGLSALKVEYVDQTYKDTYKNLYNTKNYINNNTKYMYMYEFSSPYHNYELMNIPYTSINIQNGYFSSNPNIALNGQNIYNVTTTLLITNNNEYTDTPYLVFNNIDNKSGLERAIEKSVGNDVIWLCGDNEIKNAISISHNLTINGILANGNVFKDLEDEELPWIDNAVKYYSFYNEKECTQLVGVYNIKPSDSSTDYSSDFSKLQKITVSGGTVTFNDINFIGFNNSTITEDDNITNKLAMLVIEGNSTTLNLNNSYITNFAGNNLIGIINTNGAITNINNTIFNINSNVNYDNSEFIYADSGKVTIVNSVFVNDKNYFSYGPEQVFFLTGSASLELKGCLVECLQSVFVISETDEQNYVSLDIHSYKVDEKTTILSVFTYNGYGEDGSKYNDTYFIHDYRKSDKTKSNIHIYEGTVINYSNKIYFENVNKDSNVTFESSSFNNSSASIVFGTINGTVKITGNKDNLSVIKSKDLTFANVGLNGKVIFDNCDIKTPVSVEVVDTGEVTINGGFYENSIAFKSINASSNVNINGGQFLDKITYELKGGNATINGGYFEKEIWVVRPDGTSKTSCLTLKGGYFLDSLKAYTDFNSTPTVDKTGTKDDITYPFGSTSIVLDKNAYLSKDLFTSSSKNNPTDYLKDKTYGFLQGQFVTDSENKALDGKTFAKKFENVQFYKVVENPYKVVGPENNEIWLDEGIDALADDIKVYYTGYYDADQKKVVDKELKFDTDYSLVLDSSDSWKGGAHTIYIAVNNGSYVSTSFSGAREVSRLNFSEKVYYKLKVVAKYHNNPYTYNGNEQTVLDSLRYYDTNGGLVAFDKSTDANVYALFNITNDKGTNVGKYTLTYTPKNPTGDYLTNYYRFDVDADGKYLENTTEWEITPCVITVEIGDYTYNGTEQTITASYKDLGGNPHTLAVKNIYNSLLEEADFITAGEYLVALDFADGDNVNKCYALPSEYVYTISEASVICWSVSMNRKLIGENDITWPEDNFTYNGEDQIDKLVWSFKDVGGVDVKYAFEGVEEFIDAGKYTLYINIPAPEKEGEGLDSKGYTVYDNYELPFKLIFDDGPGKYYEYVVKYNKNEDDFSSSTTYYVFESGEYIKVNIDEFEKGITYYTKEETGNIGDDKVIKYENLDSSKTYWFIPDGFAGGTRSCDIKKYLTTKDYTINQLEAILEWETEVQYSGDYVLPTVTVTNVIDGDTFTFVISNSDTEEVKTIKDIGSGYNAYLLDLGNDNYKLPDNAYTLYNIVKRIIEISWEDLESCIYNGDKQLPTATVSNLIDGFNIEITVISATDCINAGEYTVTATIPDSDIYTLPAENTATFKISPLEITFSWGNETLTYNGGSQIITASVTNLKGSDTATLTVTGAQANAGTGYTATLSAVDNTNYCLPASGLTTTFDISPLEITFSWGNETLTYNGGSQIITASVTNLKGSDTATLTVTGAQTNAGTGYTATLSAVDNTNYCLPASGLTTTFDISPLEITFSWGNETLTYNGGSQIITASVTNLKGSDTATLTVTGAQTNAGTGYTATLSAVDNTNYKLPASGLTTTFDILQKEIVLAWGDANVVYNGKQQTISVLASNMETGDEINFTMDGAQIDVGTDYTATITAIDNQNYCLPAEKSATFNIIPKEIVLSWSDEDIIYNGESQIISVSASNIETGDEINFTMEGWETNAGTDYTATITGIDNTNYKLPNSGLSTTYSIKQRTVELSFTNTEFVYDKQSHLPSVEILNLVEGDTLSLTVDSQDAQTEFGTYTATALLSGNDNYCLPDNPTCQFVINKLEIGIEWSKLNSLIYNKTAQKPTATATGVIAGDTVNIVVGGEQTEAGTYTATALSVDNTNYKLPIENTASFTISPKELLIVWSDLEFTYDGSIHIPNAMAGNLESGDTVVLTVSGEKISAGNYNATATISVNVNNNYILPSINTKEFVINKATYDMSSVYFEDQMFNYDNTDKTIEVTGELPDGVTFVYNDVNTYKKIGRYLVRVSFNGDYENYNQIPDRKAYLNIIDNELVKNNTVVVEFFGDEADKNYNVLAEIIPMEKDPDTVELVNDSIELTGDMSLKEIYDVSVYLNGIKVSEFNSPLQVKFAIPSSVKTKEFKILHLHNGELKEVYYTIDNGYVIIETDCLSEFVFLAKDDQPHSDVWFWVVLNLGSLLILGEQMLLKRRNNKYENQKDNEGRN